MSDLPLGVLEVPQFSVEVQRRDRIVSASAVAWTTTWSLSFSRLQDVVAHISECAVNWSPTQHCTAKHVLDAVVESVQGAGQQGLLEGVGPLEVVVPA